MNTEKILNQWDQLHWNDKTEVIQKASENKDIELLKELTDRAIDDPKWEVRKAIADTLLSIPDYTDFLRIANKLENDENMYVGKAAKRAKTKRKSSKGVDLRNEEIQKHFDEIERLYGRKAALNTKTVALNHSDLIIRSTAHNFATILSPLSLYAQSLSSLCKKEDIDTKQMEKKSNAILEQVGVLDNFLKEIQSYTRDLPTDFRQENVADVINDSCSLVADRANKNKIKITTKITPDLFINASKPTISMAIVNIMNNAIDALTSEESETKKPEITISTTASPDFIGIHIKNNGPSIHPDDLIALTEFIPIKSRKKKGMGLGLSIAYRYVTHHNGSLRIESEDQDGLTMTIALPKAKVANENKDEDS